MFTSGSRFPRIRYLSISHAEGLAKGTPVLTATVATGILFMTSYFKEK